MNEVSFLERITVALESIASSLKTIAAKDGSVFTQPQVDNIPADPAASAPAPAGIDVTNIVYPDEKDRAAWMELAKTRGVAVPKGTKTPTLVRKVKNFDLAHQAVPGVADPAELAAPVEQTPAAPAAPAPKSTPVAEEVDPLTAEPAEPVVTRADALQALQAVKKKLGDVAGNQEIVKILMACANTKSFPNVPEDKFPAIHKAATEVLNG